MLILMEVSDGGISRKQIYLFKQIVLSEKNSACDFTKRGFLVLGHEISSPTPTMCIDTLSQTESNNFLPVPLLQVLLTLRVQAGKHFRMAA